MNAINERPQADQSDDDDARISAAVRALAAGTGLKNAELAPVLGIHRASVFAKLKGETAWKASEVASLARYFDVPVGDLFDGLGLFRDAKKPHRVTGGASSSGAPSGIRTPDPLVKSPG
ncbi:helix-turn-helix domain-containing protein [Brachybacterium tyrofermentans]|uniref:helix-turn-helix domain-containing protein n=1 Tax=Brachybacterium tyrofermentans TaxID=47848 RepID=UPI0026D43F2D